MFSTECPSSSYLITSTTEGEGGCFSPPDGPVWCFGSISHNHNNIIIAQECETMLDNTSGEGLVHCKAFQAGQNGLSSGMIRNIRQPWRAV